MQLRGDGPALHAPGGRLRPARTTSRCCASRARRAGAAARRAGAAGHAGAILGFPHNGPYDVRAGPRSAPTQQVLTQDAYGRGPVRRGSRRCAAACARQLGRAAGRRARARRWRRSSRRRPRGARAAATRPQRVVASDRSRRLRAGRHRPCAADRSHCAAGRYGCRRRCAKTLVIAEKPSVGRDLARVLPGPFEKKSAAASAPGAGSRAPSTSSRGRSATSSSSPSPTSTTTSSRSGAWPTCRSCRDSSSSSCATSARRSR